MGRKSKQAGGHLPLTHYERTHKFSSSEYGTTVQRLAGHAQYQVGTCALSLTRLSTETTALCSPSGYLYAPAAILEYLWTKTVELKQKKAAHQQKVQDRQEAARIAQEQEREESQRRAFAAGQRVGTGASPSLPSKKRPRTGEDHQTHDEDYSLLEGPNSSNRTSIDVKAVKSKEAAREDLHRTSFWLALAQPAPETDRTASTSSILPDRPLSPHSQQPLRRRDLWPVKLSWDDGDHQQHLVCALSGKALQTQPMVAYWTHQDPAGSKKSTKSKKKTQSKAPHDDDVEENDDDEERAGKLVLRDVFDQLVIRQNQSHPDERDEESRRWCPLTLRRIRHVRTLQSSGSSFAASAQAMEAKRYRPTIT